jgi:hypothetical protein
MRSPVKAGGELRSCALSIVTREVPDRGLGMKYCPTLPSGIWVAVLLRAECHDSSSAGCIFDVDNQTVEIFRRA